MTYLKQFQILLRLLVVIAVFNASTLTSFGQKVEQHEIIATDNIGKAIFIRFSDTEIKSDDKSVFAFLVSQYALDENTTFIEKQGSAKEQNGILSKKLFQYYKGIKVEFGQLIITYKDGYLRTVNGHITPTENLNLQPSISAEEALKFALEQINAKEYAWQNEGFENLLRTEEQNPKATYYPKAELVILDKNLFEEKPDVRLAYKFDIYALSPLSSQDYYVDAHTGEYLFHNTTMMHSQGSGDTRYSGRRNFETERHEGSYRLRDYTRGLGIETYNMNSGTDYQAATDFIDNDNNWTAAEHRNAQKDDAALDAHWGAEMTYDYFLNVHGRNSWDDNGGKIKSYVHYGNDYFGAFWQSGVVRMSYGDGNINIDPLTTVDIIAHEIGHGVCQRTASLVYQKEPGAINEGLSDIWGAMVKYYADPNKATYRFADEIYVNGGMMRSLSSPKDRNQPDTYKGEFWRDVENCQPNAVLNDDCYVHTNSGIMNHWFYLLAEGGGGINDNGDAYFLTGIGKEKAAEIVYRSESVYFESRTNYEEAKMWTMQAAMDLYGSNSNELDAVCLAWYAVGVGELSTESICNTSIILRGSEVLCDRGSKAYELIFLPENAIVTWEVSPNLQIFTPGRERIAVQINTTPPIEQHLGHGYIIATVDGIEYRKDIWVGLPQVTLYYRQESSLQTSLHLSGLGLTDVERQGITTIEWRQVTTGGNCNPILDATPNDFTAFINASCSNYQTQVEVVVTNPCGSVTLLKDITNLPIINPDPIDLDPPLPCPRYEEINGVLTLVHCQGIEPDDIINIDIYNYMGIRQATYKNTDTFSTLNLPTGLYFIKAQTRLGNSFTLKYLKK